MVTQIEKCSRSVRRVADPFMVLAVYRLEADLGVPDSARGILGAAWCWEAAMRTKPRAGDEGRSYGPFQMMGWFWNRCGLPMNDNVMYNLPVAATCYMSLVQHFLDDGKCPGDFARAQAMAANGKRYGAIGLGTAAAFKDPAKKQAAYCSVRSKHWAELERWKASPAPQQRIPKGDK